MIRLVFLLLSSVLLSACASFSSNYQKLEVKDKEVVTIEIPQSLLEPCVAPTPIDPNSYVELKIWEREQYLTSYIVELLKAIRSCNDKITSIKELNHKK